jgi:hypothetical protein
VKVRLYGITVGHGSFARVTAGMRQGLEHVGCFAGLVPLDAFDEEDFYPGWDAEVGVYVGPPSQVGIMASRGEHKERWLLLPPNSTWIPRALLGRTWPHVTGYLSPSAWGASVLRTEIEKFGGPLGETRAVEVWQHGVADEFQPDRAMQDRLRARYFDGQFHALHMTSTERERKGTRELLAAWTQLVNADLLGPRPRLGIVLEGRPDVFDGIVHGRAEESLTWLSRQNLAPSATAELYRSYHVVCQPSRGEGFGLCPLEALACAVPVVATDATGHSEYLADRNRGFVRVLTGPLAPIDDGPEAQAPSLDPADVALALHGAAVRWPDLAQEALEASLLIRTRWAWWSVTDRWLTSRGRR